MSTHNDEGGSPFISAKYVRRRIAVPFSVKNISPVSIFSESVSLDHLHPFGGGEIVIPEGDSISYRRFSLGFGELSGLPSKYGPRGSFVGLEKCVCLLSSKSLLGTHILFE
jgi:hypothetical protein